MAPLDAAAPGFDAAAFVRAGEDAKHLDLAVENARCAACIAKIEDGVKRLPGVKSVRLNLSTGRVAVKFEGPDDTAVSIIRTLDQLGYPASPYTPEPGENPRDREEKRLLRALAVAGFASANVMLLSISVWAGEGEMDLATKTLMHWLSGMIALPAVAYAGWPFFESGWKSLKAGGVNMDVPISLAVLLACGLSIYETAMGHGAAYFDAAVMLLFFLLIGRWLDVRLRAKAGQAARDLAALQARVAHRIEADGAVKAIPAGDVRPGDLLLVPPGERVPADAEVIEGEGPVDASLVTGESAPQTLRPGLAAYSGMVNLAAPLTLRARAASQDSLIAEIARLVEAGEQSRSRYVRYADRAARAYVPAVFAMSAVTLVGWLIFGATPHDAVMNAIAVLIITCPCAMALVVPAVQVVACGRLYKHGVLVKSGDALERLATIQSVIFDKTGTLTEGRARLANADEIDAETLEAAARLARASRHPLSKAVSEAAGEGPLAEDLTETGGGGLSGYVDGARIRFGSAAFLGIGSEAGDAAQEAWLQVEGQPPVRFVFEDALRSDAADTLAALRDQGLPAQLLSGDREGPVAHTAAVLGLTDWRASLKPQDKIAHIEEIKASGGAPLMVGDGVNDAPALAAAHVSISLGSGAEISRSTADLVIQGDRLSSILEALRISREAKARVMENFALANIYNIIAVPLAVFGLVTPLVAAICMSASSIVVMLNALRLARS